MKCEFVAPYVKELKFPNFAKKLEYAARVCHGSEDKMKMDTPPNLKLIQAMWNDKHFSVFEHVWLEFKWMMGSTTTHDEHLLAIQRRNECLDLLRRTFGSYMEPIPVEDNITARFNLRSLIEFGMESNVFVCGTNMPYTMLRAAYQKIKDNIFQVSNDWFREDAVLGPNTLIVMDAMPICSVRFYDYPTFEVGTDRLVSHQWDRNRRQAFTQQSQRYCCFDDLCKFAKQDAFAPEYADKAYITEEMQEGQPVVTIHPDHSKDAALTEYIEACLSSAMRYERMRKNGASPEYARTALSQGAFTKFICTFSNWEWSHFEKLRCDEAHVYAPTYQLAEAMRVLRSDIRNKKENAK